MEKPVTPVNVRKNLRAALFKSLLVPGLTLVFFICAGPWLNHRVRVAASAAIERDASLSPEQKAQCEANVATRDFQAICLDCPPGFEQQHDYLARAGVVARFERLRWGFWGSLALAVILDLAVWLVFVLNERAKKSPTDLIRSYRLAWGISMAAALTTLFLLIPLLTYAVFEFSVLLTDHFLPKLLLLIVLGGLLALWRCGTILLKKIPLEFKEPMAREVSPEEAPELWAAVRAAAARLQTNPPDRILIGMQLNFYVTELAVRLESGLARGKTLFLSLPLLKQLSEAEVMAIIGHELGHFIGEDTKLTREFFPMRLKAHATLVAMARSGLASWPSFQFLNFFGWCFGETERAASRSRELLADQKAAELTSPRIMAAALVRFQVALEAIQRGLKGGLPPSVNPLDVPMRSVVQEKLAGEPAFWEQLFEKKLPHPLDTHPPLQVRLASLGQLITPAEAQAIAMQSEPVAYEKWLASREALFASLNQQAAAVLAKIQSRSELVAADYQTAAGKALLDRQFPEKRWRVKSSSYWVGIIGLGVLALFFLAMAVLVPDTTAGVILGVLGVLCAAGAVAVCLNRGGELVLNAEGIRYTGWRRPLRFAEVKNITARRQYANIILVFHWKTKQPPLARFSVFRFRTPGASLSLGSFEGKPAANAELIFKYCTRQAVQ
jgi:Zn-dependent protease with chaperone function